MTETKYRLFQKARWHEYWNYLTTHDCVETANQYLNDPKLDSKDFLNILKKDDPAEAREEITYMFTSGLGMDTAMEFFKNAVKKSYQLGTFELPMIFQSCDSFAIDYANRYWNQDERRLILEHLLGGVSVAPALVKLMHILPHRLLRYCIDARNVVGCTSIFFFFLNFYLYSCMGMDVTINAGKNPTEEDLTKVLRRIHWTLNKVHQAVKKDWIEDEDLVATEVAKLTLADSSEQQTQERQNDSANVQSGRAKTFLKGSIGFCTLIALSSLGLPYGLTPVVTPIVNNAIEKAF